METIEIKNDNCDWGSFGCDEDPKSVIAIYKKNRVWRAYGSFDIYGEEGYDELIDEISSECSVSKENIKMVKGVSLIVKEVSLKQHLNKQQQIKIANAKKKIEDAKKKIKSLKRQNNLK